MVAVVQALRSFDLFKPPGIAESIDWAQALLALDATEIDRAQAESTLGAVLKYQDDIARVRSELAAGTLSLAAQ